MRPQIEKNKEILLDEIEKYSEMPMTDSVAEHLNVYRGAYKALCIAAKETYPAEEKTESTARTVELDGDTEFEKLIISMPFDMPHAKAVASIFADHMESLCVINKRAYENVMNRIREVARN